MSRLVPQKEGIVLACAVLLGIVPVATAGDPERGAYLASAAGCQSCHTDAKAGGETYAGGGPLASPFGVFRAPNITPDPVYGIGGWSEGDFVRAVREGRRPDGRPYYPAFPYTSYAGMSSADAADIFAFLQKVPPVAKASPRHELPFPFSVREGLWAWRLFFFGGPRDPVGDRGTYLATALGHCGECHTPRNLLGVLRKDLAFSGATLGDGEIAPNVTPDRETGTGDWSAGDFRFFFRTGFTPEGDVAGGSMASVIDNTTGKLNDADLEALVDYLLDLPPVPSTLKPAAAETPAP